MKTILAILAALVVLFAGGCALVLLLGTVTGDPASLSFALIPGGVAALNVLLLMGLYGKGPPRRWAFYLLALVDAAAVLILGGIWVSVSGQAPDTAIIAVPVIGALILKAVLTIVMAGGLPAPPSP